jgi:hypothetical protein
VDQLTVFFTQMQDYIEDIDKNRVDPFSLGARTAKELGNRVKNQASEADRKRQEKARKRKLQVCQTFVIAFGTSHLGIATNVPS